MQKLACRCFASKAARKGLPESTRELVTWSALMALAAASLVALVVTALPSYGLFAFFWWAWAEAGRMASKSLRDMAAFREEMRRGEEYYDGLLLDEGLTPHQVKLMGRLRAEGRLADLTTDEEILAALRALDE